ncbi:MAG TPA: asparagine synthetase B, partial [Dehalococcoidia bacterium]|nr:asparagine synthetase B [Dehalococcoidia bacterium]
MSALAGIVRLDGQPAAPTDLAAMMQALDHRGPDGRGVWHEGATGLGHQLLRATPEPVPETLPLSARSGRCVITADARLDNRDELIAALGLGGCPDDALTDADLLLAAYERWGEACPEELLGDFAFAIWDRRAQTLFCARDHFGVKPFYFLHLAGRLFAFASEVPALLRLHELPRRLNESRIADFLAGLDDPTSTCYCDIVRLPPAHALTLTSDGSLRTRR